MKTEEILNHLEINDLSGDMRDMAETKGMDAVRTVIMLCNGKWVRCVKIDNLKKMHSLMIKYIKARKQRNPSITAGMLARDTGVPVKRVRKYLKQIQEESESGL